jgi:signal transduction histidine kinase
MEPDLSEKIFTKGELNSLLIDSLPHPALIINRERNIIAANKMALSEGSLIGGKCWLDWMHNRCISKEDLKKIDHTDPSTYKDIKCNFCRADESLETRKMQHDPNYRVEDTVYDMYWVPLHSDMFLHYAIDITERSQMERNLKQAKGEAERATKAKDEFMANMSHDLRTPLNGIMGLARLLNDTELAQDQRDLLGHMITSSDTLLGIINRIISFTRSELNVETLVKKQSDLKRLISEAISPFEPVLKEKGIAFSSRISSDLPAGMVLIDDIKFKEVLLNLLGNALKFTAEGSIEICAEMVSDNEVLLSVDDTGCGILPEEEDEIFERFNQGAGGISKKEGLGIGLPIARQYARLLGGDVWYERKDNAGSRFLFRAMFSEVSSIDNVPARNVAEILPSLTSLRVLVVEDNGINLMAMTGFLEKFVHSVDEARNGIEAINLMRINGYDIVLMDIEMPEMGGIEATRLIREELNQRVPIIALTGYDFTKEDVMKSRVDDFHMKPFTPDTLLCQMADLTATVH